MRKKCALLLTNRAYFPGSNQLETLRSRFLFIDLNCSLIVMKCHIYWDTFYHDAVCIRFFERPFRTDLSCFELENLLSEEQTVQSKIRLLLL